MCGGLLSPPYARRHPDRATFPFGLRALRRAPHALLGGCSLGPRYHRPDIPAPAAWVTQDDATARQWPPTDWWRAFASDDLNSFIAQAQLANDDLHAAIARVHQADAQRIAGAPLLPAIGAQANAMRSRAAVNGGQFVTGNDFTPFVTASYELDFWGKNRAAPAAATASARASRYDRTTVELTVMAGVATTYFQTLELRDRLAIANANLENATRILSGLRLEQRAGTALDVAQQETVAATVNATIPPLRQQLRQSLDALEAVWATTSVRRPTWSTCTSASCARSWNTRRSARCCARCAMPAT
jgi:outer membrane protein TolC